MNADNLNWKTEGIEDRFSKAGESRAFYQGGTVAFLLLSSVVLFYEAIYLVGSTSIFYYLQIAGGLLYIVLSIFCLRGSKRAFQLATRWAILRGVLAYALGGLAFASIILIIPQIFVIAFSRQAVLRSNESKTNS